MKIISSDNDTVSAYFKETKEKSSLIFSLARRDIKIKYAQSFLGVAWVLLQPITGALIFTFFFTQMFTFSEGLKIPYHLFAFSGYLCWLLFSQLINSAGTSLMQEERLIKKVYFPRIILPLSKLIVQIFDFSVGLVALIIISCFYDLSILFRFVFTVPAILLIVMNSLSIVIWLSALTIRYRDLHHIIPYIISFGIWLTPVFFPSEFFPEKYRWMLDLNPLAYDIDLFRNLLYDLPLPSLSLITISVHFLFFIILIFGFNYFLKIDRLSSDYL
jgi:lipopolysaccharide transport system permease protein